MQVRRIVIPNRLGLHARAAAKLVRLASSFRSSVQVARCDPPARSADAKNILGVLLLAATQHTHIEMVTEGDDEEAAIEALSRLIEDKFGEQE
ncbi:MAG TPA: HPr family phosphocarrier protein [Blastocatellia bacterium]|nr:HPr family phosphocarrier protein [Blastocatellia bacterium]